MCREVLGWFGGDITPARPPTLRLDEPEGDVKWFEKRINKLRLVQFDTGTTLLTILAETRQGEKAEVEKREKFKLLCLFLSNRTAIMSATHTKVHWGIIRTAETIANNFVWDKMREDFVLQSAPCLKKQGVNLKEGEGDFP